MTSRILIVIVAYNSSEYIGDCLSSLSKITYPSERVSVLLIDNASTDQSVAFVKKHFPTVAVIQNAANLGFAAGNNIGFRYAIDHGFDYVYLLNQDTVVAPDFLAPAVLAAQADSRIGAVQSKLLLYQDATKINSIGNEIHYLGFAFAGGYLLPDTFHQIKEITYPSGAATLFSVAALKDVGFFNEQFFMYHEDTDLGWRLWLGGWRCVLAPASVVYHKYEFSRSIRKYYYMERNRWLMIFQNYQLGTLLLILPALLLMDVGLLVYSLFSGWWLEQFRACWYLVNPVHWVVIFKTRRQIQKKRRVGDKEIVKRFVGTIDFQEFQNPLIRYIANPCFNAYWRIVRRLIVW